MHSLEVHYAPARLKTVSPECTRERLLLQYFHLPTRGVRRHPVTLKTVAWRNRPLHVSVNVQSRVAAPWNRSAKRRRWRAAPGSNRLDSSRTMCGARFWLRPKRTHRTDRSRCLTLNRFLNLFSRDLGPLVAGGVDTGRIHARCGCRLRRWDQLPIRIGQPGALTQESGVRRTRQSSCSGWCAGGLAN